MGHPQSKKKKSRTQLWTAHKMTVGRTEKDTAIFFVSVVSCECSGVEGRFHFPAQPTTCTREATDFGAPRSEYAVCRKSSDLGSPIIV